MRVLLPFAVIFLLAASACERVEEGQPTTLPPLPEVAGKMPLGKQPPEGVPQGQPQVTPPEGKAPEQIPPEQKAPQPTPTPSARDLLLLDMEVAARNVSAARTDLSSQQVEPAKAKIETAIRSLAFLETSLPSSRVLELLQRCAVQVSLAQIQPAVATLQEVSSLIPQVGGLANPQEATKLASGASASLSKGNSEGAKQTLESLASKIKGGEQETLLFHLKDHLRGAQYAIYRNAVSVASLELDEASKYLGQLRSLTEAAWPAPSA